MGNRQCPECLKLGHDKDKDHLWLMKDGETWCCDRTQYHPVYYEKDGESLDVNVSGDTGGRKGKLSDSDVEQLKSASVRGIPLDVCERYGFKVEYDQATRSEKKYFWPVTKKGKCVTWKFKDLTKDKGAKGHFGRLQNGIKDVDFFGMNSYHLTPQYLLITEGEFDAASADVMLRHKYKKLKCLSIPDGSSGHEIFARLKSELDVAQFVIFCFDQDSAGQKLLTKACSLYSTAKVMTFSEKDANDMLREGKQTEFIDAFENAQRYKPSCIVTSNDVKEEAIKRIEWGLDYPYKSLTNLTFGLRPRRVIGIGAGPGAGKTALVRGIQTHLMFNHKEKLGVFGLEETPADQQREMAGYIMNKPLHLPTCNYKEDDLRGVIETFDDKVYFYDKEYYETWDDIMDAMRYMNTLGVKFFFIDPISSLVARLNASDGNQYLNNAMDSVVAFLQRTDSTLFYTSHLNNPQTGPDHAAGGKVYAGQFTGSRAMWRYSTDMWGCERNQYEEDIVKRNTMKLVVLKYRKPSQPGNLYLHYSDETGILSEHAAVKGGF
jgi:twinkle protein